MNNYWIGVDIGGTFTDIVLLDKENGKLNVFKYPSTPGNPEKGAIEGIKYLLERESVAVEQVNKVVHGTTVATNAVIERNGAKTALLITKGFKDILEIRRQDRPHLYNFRKNKIQPLVSRDLIFEVDERILYDGSIEKELTEKELDRLQKVLLNKNIAAIAVCYLHSYRNEEHEKLTCNYLNKNMPEIFVSLSNEVLSEFKEYERASTTVTNSYVTPVMKKYLGSFNRGLEELGVKEKILIMQSNGGIMSSQQASNHAVQTLISGPAAGVLSGMALSDSKNFISADMGGTSFDVSLVESGHPSFTREGEIAGHELRLPRIDVNTIGAGGGSIAWIDKGGALKVGPRSSGAVPGPACYGRGGKEPTVTDAHAVLGRINPEYLLDGEMEVNRDAACEVIKNKIAEPLKLTIYEAAQGIIDIVNAKMVKGIRKISVERGYDPSDFDLISFGGAGPLHAIELADELGMKKIIIPYYPGVNSAIGLLVADYRYSKFRTLLTKFDIDNLAIVNDSFKELKKEALEEMEEEGFAGNKINYEYYLYLRYLGQGSELELTLSDGEVNDDNIDSILNEFARKHNQEYGYIRENEDIELVNIKLVAMLEGGVNKLGVTGNIDKQDGKSYDTRDVYFNDTIYKTAVYKRDDLNKTSIIKGPCIIEQFDSTTVVPPDYNVNVDDKNNIIAKKDGGIK